jgi:hypothetical protein
MITTPFQEELNVIQKEKLELFNPFSDQEKQIMILELKFDPKKDLNFILDSLSGAIKRETYIDRYNLLRLLCRFLENWKILDQIEKDTIVSKMEDIVENSDSVHSRIDALDIIYATKTRNENYFIEKFHRAQSEWYDHNWGYLFIKIFWEYELYNELVDAFKFTYEHTIYSLSLHKHYKEYFSKIPKDLLIKILRDVSKEIKENTNGIIWKTYIDAVLSISWDDAVLFLDRIRDDTDYEIICFDLITEIFNKLKLPNRPYDGFDSLLKEDNIIKHILSDLQSTNHNYFTKLLLQWGTNPITEDTERFKIMLTYDTDLQYILANIITIAEISEFCETEKKKKNWRIDFPLYEYIKFRQEKDDELKRPLLEEFEKYLTSEISDTEKIRKKYKNKEKRERTKRDKEKKDEIALGFKHLFWWNNFYFLVYKYHSNKELFTEDQKVILKEKIISFLQDKNLDPRKAELVFQRRELNWSSEYTSDWYVQNYFETTLIVAKELWINLEKYKEKIYFYVPFSYSEWLVIVDELIWNWAKITTKVIKYLLTVYDWTRSDWLRYHMTWNFVHLLERNLKLFARKTYSPHLRQVVKSLILDEKISQYVREDLLKLIYKNSVKKNKKIILLNSEDILELWEYFYEKTENINPWNSLVENSLLDLCNQIMIKHFQQEDAIKWRLNQITSLYWVEMNFDHPELIVYSPSDLESEITRERSFIDPFSYLKKKEFINTFLSLLGNSFDSTNRYYYDYIQDACSRYFLSIGNKSIYRKIVALINEKASVSTENFEYKYLPKIREKFKITLKNVLISENLERKEKFESISKSNTKLLERVKELESKVHYYENYISKNSIDVVLYVEWKTDLVLLKLAKEALEYQGKISKFGLRIINCWWVHWIVRQLFADSRDCNSNDSRFWLFDFDYEGYSCIKYPNCVKVGFENTEWWNEEIDSLLYRKHSHQNLYLMSLPFKDLHSSIQYQVNINPSVINELDRCVHLKENSHITVEHLFYGKTINDIVIDNNYTLCNKKIFERIDLPNWWNYLMFWWKEWLKIQFAEKIEETWKNIIENEKFSNNLFHSFIPIFKFIESKIQHKT